MNFESLIGIFWIKVAILLGSLSPFNSTIVLLNLVVTIGAIHSMGADAEGAWKEVMRTNFAKIDNETGRVRKREDGKVLKPVGWTPPELEPFLVKKQ